MPPSDVFHFSSSSAGTTPTSVRSSSSSSSSVTSVSPPTSPVLSSPEGRSKSGLLPSGSFHRSSRSLAPTIKSSASSSLGRSTDENSSRQREIVHKGIFLPNFLSSIRPSSQAVQASQQDRKEHRSRRAEDRDQSPERSRPHIVVTDVKSISFRDISTVPTLTTFGHKRSKRRNSSLSYSGSPSSSDSLCASLSSLPTTSRRKRIKKSSSHSRTSLRNLCTSSCGCSKSQSLSTAGADETTVVSERKRTHKRAKDQSGRIMDSTERIRTLSESEVSMSDHSQASHQLLHQHQQQQGRDQEQNHGMMQDSIQQLHMEHHRHHQQALPQAEHQEHHQPLTASQGLHDTQHSYRDGKEQHVSSNKPPLRIQLCHDRDQHHKRQRSPQTPSFQSSLSSSSTPSVNSMDRQKRARRLSSATPEEIANNGSDSRRHSQCGVQQEGAIQHPKPTMALQHQAAVPFDHESSTTNPTQRSSGNNVSENGTSVRKQHSSIPTTARRAPEHGSELISSKSAPSANPAPSTARVSTPKSAKDTSTSSKPTPGPLPAFNPATLALPITRETLRELDVPEIFKNPQVRHDVVFDPLLQFRPNFDGERGQSKRREADRFWSEVGKELNNRRSILAARRETTTNTLNMTGVSASSPTSRMIQQQAEQMWPLPKAVLLPRLIEELREILLTLIYRPGAQAVNPDGTPQVSPEQALLMSTLDPDLLMQELDHGVLDVHALFRFLGDRLKGHCAPMRDALVESMVNIVVDFDEIVRGIRMCFEILEWMKLVSTTLHPPLYLRVFFSLSLSLSLFPVFRNTNKSTPLMLNY
ncbi:T-complex protein 11-domain-containing protein [Mortierella sp. GBAus27b]|nr:T-complex protein 11-domain-containing protein [Mortierella sp. GBAus27b]